jgi:hypothetical protein
MLCTVALHVTDAPAVAQCSRWRDAGGGCPAWEGDPRGRTERPRGKTMQMHHDFRVPDMEELQRQRKRAEELGACADPP